MQMDKVKCQTPTPGKKPTNILKWKYDIIRNAILKLIPDSGKGITFKDLMIEVDEFLEKKDVQDLGSSAWYTTTVKLDLEVKGEIFRVPGVTPQRLLRNN